MVGCAPAPLIKPVPVEITKYVKATIPDALLAPCVYAEPDKACMRGTERTWCNGQLVTMLVEYRAALATCDSQIKSISDMQKKADN